MDDQLNFQDLPEEDQKVLNEALIKPPSHLTEKEKDFIRARRDYLSHQHREAYADVLNDNQKQEQVPTEPTMAELREQAEALGIDTSKIRKKDEVKAAIEEMVNDDGDDEEESEE